MHLFIKRACAVSAAVVAAVALTPGLSSASEVEMAGFTYKNEATGRCLDANDAGMVYTRTCDHENNPHQRWITLESGTVRLKNVATGQCLDNDQTGRVYTLKCNTGSFQKWTVNQEGDRYMFINLATSKVLDSNAASMVYTFPRNNGKFQFWL